MNNTTLGRSSSTAAMWFTRSVLVPLALLMGIGLSLGVFAALRKAAQRELQAAFKAGANDRAQAIEMTLGRAPQLMRDLRSFYAGSGSVERSEFHDYLADMRADNPTLLGVVWTPRVSAVDRAGLEAQAQSDGENGFRILTEQDPGHFTTAPPSPESKPVTPRALTEVLRKWLPTGDIAHSKETEEPALPPAAGAVDETPLWDRAGMLTRLMDDEDLVTTILNMFLVDIPEQIKALISLLDAGDASGVERQAHTIRGASANVGGEQLQRAASEIEKAAKAGDLAAARTRLPDLEAQFGRLKDILAARNT